MDITVKYKVKEDGKVISTVVKSAWFNSNLDKDQLVDELYEFIYVDVENHTFDLTKDEIFENIHFINSDEASTTLFNFFNEKENFEVWLKNRLHKKTDSLIITT